MGVCALEIDATALPTSVSAQLALADVYSRTGDIANARGRYTEVLRLQPTNPAAAAALRLLGGS
jgi:cytochrome c-type biogenesis protein CcmH/NrfG